MCLAQEHSTMFKCDATVDGSRDAWFQIPDADHSPTADSLCSFSDMRLSSCDCFLSVVRCPSVNMFLFCNQRVIHSKKSLNALITIH